MKGVLHIWWLRASQRLKLCLWNQLFVLEKLRQVWDFYLHSILVYLGLQARKCCLVFLHYKLGVWSFGIQGKLVIYSCYRVWFKAWPMLGERRHWFCCQSLKILDMPLYIYIYIEVTPTQFQTRITRVQYLRTDHIAREHKARQSDDMLNRTDVTLSHYLILFWTPLRSKQKPPPDISHCRVPYTPIWHRGESDYMQRVCGHHSTGPNLVLHCDTNMQPSLYCVPPYILPLSQGTSMNCKTLY